jgi:hypothetical protein
MNKCAFILGPVSIAANKSLFPVSSGGGRSSRCSSVAPFLSPEFTGEICQCRYDEKTALAVFQLHLVQLPPQLESSNLTLQAGLCQRYPLAKKQRIGKLLVRI